MASTSPRSTNLGALLLALGSTLLALALLGSFLGVFLWLHEAGLLGRAESWERAPAWQGATLIGVSLALALAGFVLRGVGMRRGRLEPATFLSPEEEDLVLGAIESFEARTSGELRVHLAPRTLEDTLAAARAAFLELGMTDTKARNGVLFFVATEERRFAIVGDEGIDAVVPEGFWDETLELVRAHFRSGRFAEGLVAGIERAGGALAEHFPIEDDDANELPDSISRGE